VEIEHFFQTYKLLEDKAVDVVGWRDAERAREVLTADREVWREARRQPPG
jgi:inorganic pyrophosphatase